MHRFTLLFLSFFILIKYSDYISQFWEDEYTDYKDHYPRNYEYKTIETLKFIAHIQMSILMHILIHFLNNLSISRIFGWILRHAIIILFISFGV